MFSPPASASVARTPKSPPAVTFTVTSATSSSNSPLPSWSSPWSVAPVTVAPPATRVGPVGRAGTSAPYVHIVHSFAFF